MATEAQNGMGYILQAINNIVEPKVDNLRYDKTYRAKVTEVVSTGVYKVQLNGAEYQLNHSGELSVGDIVKVKAPLNNFSDIYIESSQTTTVDSSLSSTSTNPVQNKAIKSAIDTVDTKITTLEGKIGIVSFTAPANGSSINVTMPTGFTSSNSMILGGRCTYGGNNIRWNLSEWYDIYFNSSSTIYFQTNNSLGASKAIVLFLYKYQ